MDYVSKYVEFLKKHIDIKRPLKIVCDTSNGAASIVLEKLVNIPNMELILINSIPDPEFPAHGPNPTITGATDMLSQTVLKVGADFGVIFDADGDRAFFVDNQGELLLSFVIAAIWFSYSIPPFVTDELEYLSLTTNGLFKEQDVIPTHVGTIFIKEAMQKSNAILGAEFSGHFYFKEFFGLDSGIFSMIYAANVLSKQDKTLSELHKKFSRQALVSDNIALEKTTWNKVLENLKKETSSITKNSFSREGLTLITENGWVNVRASHTEPLIRISVGATTKEIAEHDLAFIVKIIQKTDEEVS
jgi:phosphomannomutase